MCCTNKKKTVITRLLGSQLHKQLRTAKETLSSWKKIVKNCYAFYYYLSILALLSIEIIDSLGSLSSRQYFLRFNFTPHIIWTFRHNCHLAVHKLKMEGKIKYFHSNILTLTFRNEKQRMIMTQNCATVKQIKTKYINVHKCIRYNYFRSIQLF